MGYWEWFCLWAPWAPAPHSAISDGGCHAIHTTEGQAASVRLTVYRRQYPKPKGANPLPCSPPLGGKPFLVAFWGFLSWGLAFVLGVLWPAGARFPPGPPEGASSKPCQGPGILEKATLETKHEGGNLGLALNPKRWKFGWLACRAAEWGEKKKGLAQLLGTTYPRVTPYHHLLLCYAATLTPFRCVGGAIHA